MPIEGVLSMDPKDPGNYTPSGVLKGTKYGISARSFPSVDIANLTLEQAKAIAKPRYWDTIRGDEIHPWLALLLFDSSYNEGPDVAIKHLQATLGIAIDGAFGGQTLMAVELRLAKQGLYWVLAEYSTQRALNYTRDKEFETYAHSWLNRTATVLLEATKLHS